MKRSVTGIFVALAFNLSTLLACAAGAPVAVTHTLTGYSKEAKAVSLEYSLHVVNQGKTSITELSLSLVPRPPFVSTRTSVNIGSLAAGESTEVQLKLVTPFLLDREQFSKKSLLWAGRCLDAGGKRLEFPVKSLPGGAR